MEFRTLAKAVENPRAITTKAELVDLTVDIKLSGLRATASTANEVIKKVYGLDGKKLNTFQGWKAEGKSIKKGAKAYTFWSSKKTFTKEVDGEDKEFKFFNICKLFSQDDVE